MGVDDCDTMLMLLSASTEMTSEQRDVMTTKMMKGFNGMSVIKTAGPWRFVLDFHCKKCLLQIPLRRPTQA